MRAMYINATAATLQRRAKAAAPERLVRSLPRAAFPGESREVDSGHPGRLIRTYPEQRSAFSNLGGDLWAICRPVCGRTAGMSAGAWPAA